MSGFHRFSAFVPRSVGLGFACGAFVGAALVATTVTTTMKPRFMVNVNRRRPLACLLSDWLNISSSSKALDNVRHPYNLLSKLFQPLSLDRLSRNITRPTLVPRPPPIASPQRSLLFHGTAFNNPALSPISPDLTVDTTQLDGQSGHLSDDDQLDSALCRQDVPAIVLTVIDGGGSKLMTALPDLETTAAREQLPLTLLVEFKGDTSSTTRTIQHIINSLKERFQCLAVIYMPQDTDDSFPDVEISQQLVNPTQSSTLQHLVWRGNHISELSLQWGSASDFPFQSLRTLSLTCKLALDDCIQILFQCESLTSFSVWSLVQADSFMKHDFHAKEVPHLKSLTIKSDVLLDKLFKTLHMAQLDSIDLELGPDAGPTDGVHNLALEWDKLLNVRLVGILNKAHCDYVREECTGAELLHLETLRRLY